MAGREAMIAQAEQSLGLGESGGNNTNYITRWYGLSGQPWCNQAVTYWAFKSGNQSAVTYGGKFAYTVAHAAAFQRHGQYHAGASGVRRGDIVFFTWHDGGDGIDHVGICTGTNARGDVVYTIEGNIGNVCARKVRTPRDIAGYGRPAYAGEAAVPPPKPPGEASPYVLFPGEFWFRTGRSSKIITSMGGRLVAVGCGAYSDGPGPQWTDADRTSYARWQRRCGYSGADANGWPGKTTWDKLKVPR